MGGVHHIGVTGLLRGLPRGQGKEIRCFYRAGLWDLRPCPIYARPSRSERGNVATAIAAGLTGHVGLNEVAAGIMRQTDVFPIRPY